jgi:hypothetical protein
MTSSGKERQSPADVEIGAAARAKRLRFRRKPETRVEFGGSPGHESDSHSERQNLPEEVEPGVTYRDVVVRWTAGARISEDGVKRLEERIAAKGRQGAQESKES